MYPCAIRHSENRATAHLLLPSTTASAQALTLNSTHGLLRCHKAVREPSTLHFAIDFRMISSNCATCKETDSEAADIGIEPEAFWGSL